MSENKHLEQKLQALANSARPSADFTDAVMAKVRQCPQHQSTHKTQSRHWLPKLLSPAIAAIILLALFIGLNTNNIPFDGASIAWADIIKNMKLQGWVYLYDNIDGHIRETWYCPEKEITCERSDKRIRFTDHSIGKSYIYNKKRNVIEIVYKRNDHFTPTSKTYQERFNTPYDEIEYIRNWIKEENATSTASTGTYRGDDVHIVKYTSTDKRKNDNKDGCWLTMYLDKNSSLLRGYAYWTEYYDNNYPEDQRFQGIIRYERAFSYPDPGPQNIYDLGAPQEAPIDNMYDEQYIKLIDTLYQQRDAALDQIAYIIVDAKHHEATVSYSDKNRYSHSLMSFDTQKWAKIKAAGNANYDTCLQCVNPQSYKEIKMNDGQYKTSLCLWDTPIQFYKTQYAGYDSDKYDELSHYAWGYLNVWSTITEDDYSKANNLICVKRIQRLGENYTDMFYTYFNPEKNYIRHRQKIQWSSGREEFEDVQEYQLVNGYWYPKTIRRYAKNKNESSQTFDYLIEIYIDESPTFTDDLFDTDSVEKRYQKHKEAP